MKRIIAALIMCHLALSQTMAQGWKMTITKTDGTTQELLTSDIKDISFTAEEKPLLKDKNADQIIIKEVYCGGCQKDDGSGAFQNDKCVILYNNCPQQAVVNNLCIAFTTPYNSNGNNKNYDADGELV